MNLVTVAGSSSSSFAQRDWLFAIGLFAVTLASYFPAWNGQPIWDDDVHLTTPELRSLSGLVQIWTRLGSTQQYYPITHTIFWIEHRIWGDTPLFYHLVNNFLHVTAALLLVKALKMLGIPGAWFAGAIFALHPVQVESVAWMSELKNTLSAVFFLFSGLVYLKFDRERTAFVYFAALALFSLGLLSKTVIAILPAIILVILWWKRGKLSLRRDVLPLVPFFVVAIAVGLFTAWVERNFIGAAGRLFDLSFVQRVLIAGRAFWFYLSKLFWPNNLIFIYPRWDVRPTVWWEYVFPLGTVILFVALWMMRKKSRGPLAAFLFFIGMLVPALGFFNVFPFLYAFVADHFQYLACIGIITLVAAGFTQLIKAASPRYGRVGVGLGLVLVGALAILTWQQSHAYQDEETLWRTTISRNPGCWMAYNNLGKVLVRNGRLDEAITQYAEALAHAPPEPERAHYNLAGALVAAGNINSAIEHYDEALKLKPDYVDAHYNLGGAFIRVGRIDEAIEEYNKSLQIRPSDADVRNNLGSALLQKGRVQEAISQFRVALQSDSRNPEIEQNLAYALATDGQVDEAIAHYRAVLDLQPNNVDARYELGSAFLQKGAVKQAIATYEELLAKQPDHAAAHTKLGNLFLQQGNMEKAVEHYEKSAAASAEDVAARANLAWVFATASNPSLRNGNRALELAQQANYLSRGKDPLVLRSLAAAYAETGRFVNAVQTADEALKLAAESDNRPLLQALSKEIEFYKAGTPYRKR